MKCMVKSMMKKNDEINGEINDEKNDEINGDENNMRCSEDCKTVIFETDDSNDDTNQDTTVISKNTSDRNSIRTEDRVNGSQNLNIEWSASHDWKNPTFLNEVSKEHVSDSSNDQSDDQMVEIDLVEEESFLENSESFVDGVPANRVDESITNSNKDIFNVPKDNLELQYI